MCWGGSQWVGGGSTALSLCRSQAEADLRPTGKGPAGTPTLRRVLRAMTAHECHQVGGGRNETEMGDLDDGHLMECRAQPRKAKQEQE